MKNQLVNNKKNIWQPHKKQDKNKGRLILGMFLASIITFIISPFLLPDSYSWVEHTTSQASAQGVEGAWMGRFGFLFLGFGVILLTSLSRRKWSRAAYWFHFSFGVFMIAVAVFSSKSWVEGMRYDPVEDLLHSLFATFMGFSFSFGVFFRAWQRRENSGAIWILDFFAVFSAIVFPLLMGYFPATSGLWQRILFAVAFLWYGKEPLETREKGIQKNY